MKTSVQSLRPASPCTWGQISFGLTILARFNNHSEIPMLPKKGWKFRDGDSFLQFPLGLQGQGEKWGFGVRCARFFAKNDELETSSNLWLQPRSS